MVDGISQKLNISDSTLVKPAIADFTAKNDSVFTGYFEEKEPVKSSASEIAKKLAETIYGLGNNGKIERYLNLINKDNFRAVMEEYKKITEEKNAKLESYIPNWLPGREKMLSTFAPKESLLTTIYNETNLTFSEKAGLMYDIIKYLVLPENKDIAQDIVKKELDTYLKRNGITYEDDIIQDLMNNKYDAPKALVDIFRKTCRESREISYEKTKSTNAKIDKSFIQGKMSDCWLISGIHSIISTKNGNEYLNSLLEKDEVTGNVTVELRGVGEKIVVTQEEIEGMSHLSNGDGDVRAIEIAVDKYIRNEAYKNPEKAFAEDKYLNRLNLASDSISFCYDVLVGNSNIDDEAVEKIINNEIDFNDVNKKYSAIFHGDVFYEEEGKALPSLLNQQHAFSVIKGDEEFIYLKDPSMPNRELKVARKNISSDVIISLQSCELPK